MKIMMNIKKYIALCFLAFTLGTLTKCAEEFTSPDPITGNTLVDVAATDTTLQILTASLAKTGIGISLDNINSGQHTLFAPSDSAFRAYFQTIIGSVGDDSIVNYVNALSGTSNPTLAAYTLRLQYHVVSSEAMADDIHSSQVFTTINGARLSLSKTGSNIYINGNAGASSGKFRRADIDGANGVIHVIDKFLTAISTSTTAGAASVVTSTGFGLGITVSYATSPPTVTNGATGGNNYDLFALSLKKTGLATTVRPNVAAASLPDFTFFTPDDAAMIAYLSALPTGGSVVDEATAKTFINSLADADPDAEPPVIATDPTLTEYTNLIKYHIVSGRVLATDFVLNQDITTLLADKKFKPTAINLTASPFATFQAVGGTADLVTSKDVLSNAGILHRLNAVLKPVAD